MSTLLDELKAAALKCTRCGQCLTICPVYGKTYEEATSSRGKLFLLRSLADGTVIPTQELMELAARCTLCMRCKSICPSGVNTTELIMALRHQLKQEGKLPLAKKIAFKALTKGRLFDMAMSHGKPFQSMLFKRSANGRGKVSRLPLPVAGLNKRRIIPEFADTSLRKSVPAVSKAEGPIRGRVAFFPGCMLNYVYVGAGKDLIKVLTTNGIEVHLLDKLQCCGTPLFSSGDFEGAALLAENNVRLLSGGSFDAIITGCATCGSALKKEYGAILPEGRANAAWEGLKDRVFDFSDFLLKLGPVEYRRELPLKVTYHDACHLVRGMGVSKQPRDLIRAIPGVKFVEMKRPDVCCGCAGTFSATHYDLSQKILEDKTNDILSTGADIVATGCSACKMQLIDGLTQKGSLITAMHTAELLGKAYGV